MQKQMIKPVYTQPDALRQNDRLDLRTMRYFVESQIINSARNLMILRPFKEDEFGSAAVSPSPAHIEAVNNLMMKLQHRLLRQIHGLQVESENEQLSNMLMHKTRIGTMTKAVEQVWNYYFELFGQRQTRFAKWLLATDRIARDCYQAIYSHLDIPQSIPSPPPFSYMETTRTPSTFRRGIKFSRIGRNLNPFPIVQLPYHRLSNPWTLGAVHHEVAHNLQSDLRLWGIVPRRIHRRLTSHGLPPDVAHIWAHWHKEIWADLAGLLLGGPATVTSLIDVLARSKRPTMYFHERGVHPIPFFRLLINTKLLHRMGFTRDAERYEGLWHRLYPDAENSRIPPQLLSSFNQAAALVVDEMCYKPYQELGNRSLAQIAEFTPVHQQQTFEAAERLARGIDPGIIPARFLVAASRHALERRFASPEIITRNFYRALANR